VDPAWVDSLSELDANELFDEVGDALRVPPDLLRALSLTETGIAATGSWVLADEGRVAQAAAVSGLPPTEIQENRASNVAAAAALLRSWADVLGTDGHDAEADGGWWSALSAFASVSEPWLGDRYALEVYEQLQNGAVSPVLTPEGEIGPEVIVLQPRAVPALDGHTATPGPASLAWTPEFPGAAEAWSAPSGGVRTRVERIVLRATGASYSRSIDAALDANPPHYIVQRSSGLVTQLVPEGELAPGEQEDTLVLAIATRDDSWIAWTPAAVEGSARLAAWIATRHDFELGPASVAFEVGEDFPEGPWLGMAACFANTGSEACADGLAGSPDGPVEPAEESGGEARDGADASGWAGPIPYFYQYANSYNPGGSCQNTSVAMVLKRYGWNGTPDQISNRFGTTYAQSPGNLAQMFNTLAQEAGLSVRLTARTSGTVAGLRALLASGKPTIVHGYFTGYGHVLVALGYDGSQYTVNDPAGRWAQSWKGGYPYGWNASIGKGIRYGRAAFEQAIATSNGSAPLPLWYHELTGVPASTPPPATPPPSGPAAPTSPGGESADSWASVQWIEPTNGFVSGDPLLLRARRVSGQRIEFWSGAYRLAETLENPGSAIIDISRHGERSLTAKNLSQWGTVLASRTIHGTVVASGSITPMTTNLGSNEWLITSVTDAEGVAYVDYRVDNFLLVDVETGQSRATGTDYGLRYNFTAQADDRVLVARAYDAAGNVIATGQKLLDVDGSPPAECHVAGFIGCGESVTGDTMAVGSDLLNGYPDFVGNYSGPEVGYRFSLSAGGPVEFRFIDPRPTVLDQDIFILRSVIGQCTAPDVVARGFNSVSFEGVVGAEYVVLIDGFAGAAGAFQLEMDCDP
jgi:hypothetical protein